MIYLERRVTSLIFQRLSEIIEKEKPVMQMGYESLVMFRELLGLKSIAMVRTEKDEVSSILSIPDNSLNPYTIIDFPTIQYDKNNFAKVNCSKNDYYIFKLSMFGFLVMDVASEFHPLFIVELSHIIHFIEDCFSAINDCNEKRQLQQELSHEKKLLRTIIDAIPETIAFKDLNETYRLTNKRTDIEYRNRFDTIEGRSISEVYPKHEQPVVRALDNEVIKTQAIVRKEIQMLTDHGYVTYDTIRTPVYDENDQLIGIVSIGRDISESVHMKAILKRNAEFQELLVRIATNFINIANEDFDFVINEALAQIGKFINADRAYVFNYDFETGTTSNTHEWCNIGVSQEIGNLQNIPIGSVMTEWVRLHKMGKEVYIPNVENLDKESDLYKILDSQKIRSVISVPLMSEGKPIGFVGFDDVKDDRFWNEYEKGLLKVLAEIITNLFNRKSKEEEIILSRTQAEKANQAKSDFLANMSHEIRTPLSGIYNSFYLLNTTTLSKEQLDYIDIGFSSVDSLNIVVNSILDLSKIEAEKLELYRDSFNLENELFKLIRMQQIIANEKNIDLIYDFDYAINCEIFGDSGRLRQIILNLVNNAIKFTTNGFVKLTVKLEYVADTNYNILFEIEDTGVGISEDDIVKVTDKFYQVDSSVSKNYSGTGLGLTIANGLINLFGSKLAIASKVGIGSIFSFEIPFEINLKTKFKYPMINNKNILLVTDFDCPCIMNRVFSSMSAQTSQVDSYGLNELYQNTQKKYDFIVLNSNLKIDYQAEIIKMKYSLAKKDATFILCCDDFTNDERIMYESYGFQLFIDKNVTRDSVYSKLTRELGNTYNETSSMNKNNENMFISLVHHKILVVDDNKLNRKALEIILTKHGFNVDMAENGIEAIQKVQIKEYDIVLMDVQMPGISGIETTKRIRKMPLKTYLPIIAVTAHAFQSDYLLFKNNGMDDVITKPIKMDQLMSVLMRFIKKTDFDRKPLISINIPSENKVFDRDDFITRFDDFGELALQIIHTFMQDYQKDILHIEKAIDELNFDLIISAAHYFKGSSEYLSAKRVVWLLKRIIDDAQLHLESNMNGLLDLLKIETDLLIGKLNEFIHEREKL